jgi:uncharacterized damage-inducible protein DinB
VTWHGPSLTDALKGVTAEQAARRPIPRAHTIWELVLHLAAWRREVARRLDGQRAGDPPEGDWPPMPETTDAGWRTAKRDLLRSHRTLLAAIAELTPGRLQKPVKDYRESKSGVGATVYRTLHGIAHHDAYHAGQIAILKHAL